MSCGVTKTEGFQQPKAVSTQGGKRGSQPTNMTRKQEYRLTESLIIDLDATLEVWKCLWDYRKEYNAYLVRLSCDYRK